MGTSVFVRADEDFGGCLIELSIFFLFKEEESGFPFEELAWLLDFTFPTPALLSVAITLLTSILQIKPLLLICNFSFFFLFNFSNFQQKIEINVLKF